MKIDKQILEKYFKGLCTPEEAVQVENYLAQESPEVDDFFNEVYALSEAKEIKKTGFNIYRRMYSAAAAVIILLGVCAWLWQSRTTAKSHAQLALKWDTLKNESDDIKLLSLADGSKVWLRPNSTLAWNYNYNDTSRELSLSGEAYFEVAQDPTRPFSVRTGSLVTTALGTSFNITTTSLANGEIQVSLIEGKVALTAAAFSCILSPGQTIKYGEGMTNAKPQSFNKEEVLDWKSGKLIFDRTPLKDAFAKLQSRLGGRIIMDSTFAGNRKVSGTFSSGESLDHILEALQYVHGFKIVKKDHNTYEIIKAD
jgi:transmembrane sensor